jgi:hypothetical protein
MFTIALYPGYVLIHAKQGKHYKDKINLVEIATLYYSKLLSVSLLLLPLGVSCRKRG